MSTIENSRAHIEDGAPPARLRRGVVLQVSQDHCAVQDADGRRRVGFAAQFPSPRSERVSPGHLVAVATSPDGTALVMFRWYDAVVIGEQDGLVRLWEPGHGEVLATPRDPELQLSPGARAYLSAGLPGAEWWVAGIVATKAEDADVELEEVERFCDEHELWTSPG